MNTRHSQTDRGAPIGEADLHAYVDGQLPAARRLAVEAFLAEHAECREQVRQWELQKEALQHFYRPVLDEPIPLRLSGIPAKPSRWGWGSVAAGVAIAAASAGIGWFARGEMTPQAVRLASQAIPSMAAVSSPGTPVGAPPGTFYERAAVAHTVYAPDARRPVEVGADQEQSLATWLSKRLGATVKPPHLTAVGYELVGGRLLPGGSGPVAQFMYSRSGGQRLTLYVTREAAGKKTGFQFKEDGPVNVFYWVDEQFGYAISGAADRAELLKVSEEVYKQLQ